MERLSYPRVQLAAKPGQLDPGPLRPILYWSMTSQFIPVLFSFFFQVEMCLLGYTLGLVIQVIRPSQVDKEDFIAYYPPLDDVPKYTPTVTLVAEDDRHYNIVM